MQAQEIHVSVVDPIGPSIEHTKHILFRPFDLERWLAIGFCAWLATFGEGGGSGLQDIPFDEPQSPTNQWPQIRDFIVTNLDWLIPVVIVGMVIIVGLCLLFLWLSSRGRFMFLNCVLYNTAEVVRPWHYYKHLAHSLLMFRIALWLIGMGVLFGLGILTTAVIIPLWHTAGPSTVLSLIFLIPLIILVSLCFLIIEVFTADFAVPLMLKHTLTCTGAWSQLRELMSFNKGRFLLYVIVKCVINIVIGTLLFIITIATCCCAGCLMAIPYIGTVLLLPIIVFKRAYSLHYLRQYGHYFDLLVPSQPVEPTPPGDDEQAPPPDSASPSHAEPTLFDPTDDVDSGSPPDTENDTI